MTEHIVIVTAYAVIAAMCWMLTGITALLGVFARHIQDTVTERIGLGWVSIGCFAAAWNILHKGIVSDLVLFVSAGFGFYTFSLLWKNRHCFGCRYPNLPPVK